MACHWRIRHKLMLGLGLVVAITALLLAGTLKGLSSYRATMKAMNNKLAELKEANTLQANVAQFKATDEQLPETPDQVRKLEDAFTREVTEARGTLTAYQQQLHDTVSLGRDPRNGYDEQQQVGALEAHFAALFQAMGRAPQAEVGTGGIKSLMLSDQDVMKEIGELVRTSADLVDVINKNLATRITQAQEDYKLSLAIVLSTSVIGILLTAGLVRFFYSWIFHPIRDLQQGAGRVAQGDFEHRIEVHSGDEMEELAAAFNDMTGRLREMYSDLARQVNERSRQLVRSERLAGVGFLAAGVAHEINNPLASIAFCSEALERRLEDVLASVPEQEAGEGADREVIAKYLKMIQQEAFRCKEITQRLLEFSRGGERRREQTDLAEVVRGVLDVVQHLQNCRGKQLTFEPAGPLLAWINAQEIKSVVLNLVVNALDSMEDGGTLQIDLRQRDGMAEMVFADSGCGMSPEILENIFEPFFTRSRTGKGTGLGLSISHRIINQHGGEIEAVSPGPNQGSTFTVRLPLQPAEAPAAPGTDGAPGDYPVFPARAADGAPETGLRRHAA